ncbi:MAG: helix-turn-helix domain-containing protein [Clostridiales bacterium]|nr:helix-turn-helix domain-containing protein [Clostridiales bacterium]
MLTIKEMRSLLGLTQAEFGAKYNIPIRTIEDWERGVRTPPQYVLELLGRCALEDSAKMITGRDEIMAPDNEEIRGTNAEPGQKLMETILLDGKGDSFGIYQINRDGVGREYIYEGTALLQKLSHKVDGADYDLIYVCNLSETEIHSETEVLDMIYERFNLDLPEDFRGHSLSVSDVILMNQEGKTKAWYVDSIGFTELPEFVQERKDVVDLSRKAESKVTESVAAQNPPQEKREQQKPHRGR